MSNDTIMREPKEIAARIVDLGNKHGGLLTRIADAIQAERAFADARVKSAMADLSAVHDKRASELLASNNEMLERARAVERERDELRKDIEELRLAFSKAALANATLRIERDAAAQSHRIKPVLMSLTGPSPAALFWAERLEDGNIGVCSFVEDDDFAGLMPLPERDRFHIVSTLRGTIVDKPETWDDAVDPKPFATSGAEAQYNEHQAHACPFCGGSGHANCDASSPSDCPHCLGSGVSDPIGLKLDAFGINRASLQRHATREDERGANAAADLDRWHQDARAALTGMLAYPAKVGVDLRELVNSVTKLACEIADAMAAERRKREGSAT